VHCYGFFYTFFKMKVLFLDKPLIFDVVPRQYPSEIDTLTLTLRKEMTSEVLTPDFTFTVGQKLRLIITDQPEVFKVGDKYEIEIKNNIDVIYLGKLIIVNSDTDVQNFEYTTQNGRFTY